MARVKPLMEVLSGVTRFGRLTVIGEAPRITSESGFAACAAFVRCDCGVEKIVRACGLKSGATTSCGCLWQERHIAKLRSQATHGNSRAGARTTEYAIWVTMKARCHNANSRGFGAYGGRGIEVCQRWRDSFEAFLKDMGPRPSKSHSLERSDNDGNYEPGNCRWATMKEQSNNRRSSRTITFDGQTRTAAMWAERLGISRQMIYQRMDAGWCPADILTKPNRKRNQA